MALLGAPLVGDPLYRTARTKQINPNPPECVLKALSVGKPGTIFWLHASAVEYSGMPNGERIVVSAPLPSAFETLLASLRAGARDE
jgi:23S rRNA-/tRNA-specific pseudouridylate synthase